MLWLMHGLVFVFSTSFSSHFHRSLGRYHFVRLDLWQQQDSVWFVICIGRSLSTGFGWLSPSAYGQQVIGFGLHLIGAIQFSSP